jgi:hypothetical protein
MSNLKRKQLERFVMSHLDAICLGVFAGTWIVCYYFYN